jgi:DNA-directed RNA polymerase specialized sigma24 family protein
LEAVLMGRRVTEGDTLERWFTDQRPRLVRTAHSILRDREEAEDVVQQTLLAVWERSQREQVRNPGGYLARAVYWNALKRRARRRIETSLDALPEPPDRFTSPFPADSVDAFELELAGRDPAAVLPRPDVPRDRLQPVDLDQHSGEPHPLRAGQPAQGDRSSAQTQGVTQ